MNVLILSCSRGVSLVKAFQDALAQNGGGDVIATDSSPYAPALYFADKRVIAPASDSHEFVPFLMDLCREHQVNLVLSPRNGDLPVLAENRGRLREIGTTAMVASPETIDICLDKVRFGEFCASNGFETPKTYSAPYQEGGIQFPVFVKPRFGQGSKSAVRVDSNEQLEVLRQQEEMVVQEFVAAPEFTIDTFADFDGNVISAVPRERIRTFGGESFVARTVQEPVLIEESARIARSLGLVGHNTVQCFLQDGVARFIEVNPRFGGGAHLGFEAGAPTPLYLMKLLNGDQVEHAIDGFEDGKVMLRYTDDLFLTAGALMEANAGVRFRGSG